MPDSLPRWVLARRGRAVWVALSIGALLLATLAALLFTAWMPAAFVAFLIFSDRPRWALGAAALTVLPACLALAVAGEIAGGLGLAAAIVLPALLGAWVIRRTGSFNFAVQIVILLGVLVPVVAHALLADPASVFRPTLAELGRLLREHSWPGADQLEAEVSTRAWGSVGQVISMNAIGGLLVGLYWHGQVTGAAEAGPRFRALKVGRVLTLLLLALMVAALFNRSGLAINMLMPIAGGLILQALALLHWARSVFQFGTGWLIAAYASLLVPVMQAVWPCLGLLDNWLPLRERLLKLAQRRG